MGNIFNDDFRDFILALNHHKVAYVLVGGYSVILHSYASTTGDLDIWVDPTQVNISVKKCFSLIWNATFDATEVKGFDLEEAFRDFKIIKIGHLSVRLILYHHLIKAENLQKIEKDPDDLENLSEGK